MTKYWTGSVVHAIMNYITLRISGSRLCLVTVVAWFVSASRNLMRTFMMESSDSYINGRYPEFASLNPNLNVDHQEQPLMQSPQGPSLSNDDPTVIQYIYLQEDSSSTTTSNLPGPSRVIGRLFSLLGVRIEQYINTKASEVQYQIISPEASSSSTTSNLPGPSRAIGKMFSLMGEKLERRINLVSDKLGHGPQAFRRKLSKEYRDSLQLALTKMTAKQREMMVKKLVGYVRYDLSLGWSSYNRLTSF